MAGALLPVAPRYELMPFDAGEAQASELPVPVRLTITASPRHGLERTFAMAVRLRRVGHAVTPHLAARMVQSRHHLDELLTLAASVEIDDVLVIGGDAAEPAGPYASAAELLDVIVEHPLRPVSLGIAAYPEGHPLIRDEDLLVSLRDKSQYATYLVSQLCFDPVTLLQWLERTRGQGITLPAFVGIPGVVDRRRLLEISMRVGVGPSLSFLRKQHGIRRLFRNPTVATERLYETLTPHLKDPRLPIAGFHYYTFNELTSTWRWQRARHAAAGIATGSG